MYLARYYHSSVVLLDGSVLVMGGSGSGPNEIWKSSSGGLSWSLLTNTAWGTGGGNKLNLSIYKLRIPTVTSLVPHIVKADTITLVGCYRMAPYLF
jgi:hypothetical protein